ncbi:putative SWI/SNF-related matrix-associated actin-dependent regulator of chromatin subfamily A member 3-like 2, partial [Termitomyces sp. T112]
AVHNQTPHVNFSLNYDFQTPLRTIDFGGPDQEQRMAEFVTKSIDNLSHGLTVKKAMQSLGLKDAKDLLPGMEVRLLSHQAIGVAWMIAKEESSDRGGILADDMGLGKTVQMIATMVKNQASLDEEHRTTLIVVPAALLNQWKEEVETKTNGVFTVHLHHGRDKLKVQFMMSLLIVIAQSD